jgi:hypothetical protein
MTAFPFTRLRLLAAKIGQFLLQILDEPVCTKNNAAWRFPDIAETHTHAS